MKTVTKLLVMGLGVITGATLGITGAQASPGGSAAGESATAPTSTTSSVTDSRRYRDRLVGYYRSRGACERAGQVGERYDAWDDYDCDPISRRHDRAWALMVDWDRDYDDWTGVWPSRWPYRPDGGYLRPGSPNWPLFPILRPVRLGNDTVPILTPGVDR